MVSKDVFDGSLGGGVARSECYERGSLRHSAAQPPTEADQRGARPKCDAPAPGFENCRAQRQRQCGHGGGSEDGPASRSHLREGGISASLMLSTVLERQQHGPGPFPADCRTLGKAQYDEECRAPRSPSLIGRK